MKQFLIFSEDFSPYPGGIAQWAAGIGTSLKRKGQDVSILARHRPGFHVPSGEALPFPVDYVKGRRWKQWRTLYCHRAFKDYIQRVGAPDTVIATTWNVARGLVGLCRKHGVELVVVAHALEVTRNMSRAKRRWMAWTMRAAARIVCVSRFTRDRLLSRVSLPSERVLVLPNGVDAGLFRPGLDTTDLRRRLGIGKNDKIVLTLARVIERKGHDVVLKALPKVLELFPGLVYIIAGPRNEVFYQKLLTLVSEMGLEERVLFHDYIDASDLPLFYNLCDVYIMPSRELKERGDTEGFGITFLEANACGKPVIGGDSGGVADAVADGETGFLVDPLDVDAVAEKLIFFLSDPTTAEQIGRNGRKRVEEMYTWDAVAGRFLNALNKKG